MKLRGRAAFPIYLPRTEALILDLLEAADLAGPRFAAARIWLRGLVRAAALEAFEPFRPPATVDLRERVVARERFASLAAGFLGAAADFEREEVFFDDDFAVDFVGIVIFLRDFLTRKNRTSARGGDVFLTL